MRNRQHTKIPSVTAPLSRVLVLAFVVLSLIGCEGPAILPVTPNVLRDGSGSKVLAQLPQDQHVADMPIIYFTDRNRIVGKGSAVRYGTHRSVFMSFGIATVSLNPTPTWDELVQASGSDGSGRRYTLSVPKVDEVGNFSITPASFEFFEGSLRLKPAVADMIEREKAKVLDLVRSRLASTSSRDVYIYVHGVDNSFEDAVSRTAVMWHYTGRKGVFIAFTWPAGKGGALGYFYDRESGEFAVHHLEVLITELAKCPEVERIHLIAHSRGCDVTTTALREINLQCRARGQSAQKELKLQTLALAAADLDADVFGLRLVQENMGVIAKQFVIYSSSKDKAVGLADWLFTSKARLGTLSRSDVSEADQELLAQLPGMQCVQCFVSGFGTTHDYMFTNPGAMSDLILVLRDQKNPGAANGRPLTALGGAFWKLDNNYALPAKKPTAR